MYASKTAAVKSGEAVSKEVGLEATNQPQARVKGFMDANRTGKTGINPEILRLS